MHIDYFKAGLEANEHCVWAISDPITREVALKALRRAIPSFKHYFAEGRIDILPGYEWYLKGGDFDPKRITGGWSEKLSAALAMGRDGSAPIRPKLAKRFRSLCASVARSRRQSDARP
jgi:hypothetical protein